MTDFIRHLLELDRWRNGKKTEEHERKRLYQWIFGECQMRWTDATKRGVWNLIQEVTENGDI